VLAIIVGILILISPLLGTLITATFLIYLLAFETIFVGVMEIVTVIRERELYAKIWPVLLSGVLYVLFGLLLLFAPMIGALALVMVGGVMMIIFSFALFGYAWKLWQTGH
jgi:uncharacterized membrane protein HdeD (DUF308 family)